MVRRAVARATFGTALEWFDFALYGVVAATISEAVLSVARPDRVAVELLGGTRGPSARRGDLRHARRNLMLVTVSVMGPSSFLMGLFTVTSSRAVGDPRLPLESARIRRRLQMCNRRSRNVEVCAGLGGVDLPTASELAWQYATQSDSFRDCHYNDDHRQRWVVLDAHAVIIVAAYFQGPRRQKTGPFAFTADRLSSVSHQHGVVMSKVDHYSRNCEQEVMLVISIQTLPGKGHEQIVAYEKLAPLVRAEQGCLQYDLHSVVGDENRFVLIERWASTEALAAHDVTPHMIAADAHSPTFRAAPARVLQLAPDSLA